MEASHLVDFTTAHSVVNSQQNHQLEVTADAMITENILQHPSSTFPGIDALPSSLPFSITHNLPSNITLHDKSPSLSGIHELSPNSIPESTNGEVQNLSDFMQTDLPPSTTTPMQIESMNNSSSSTNSSEEAFVESLLIPDSPTLNDPLLAIQSGSFTDSSLKNETKQNSPSSISLSSAVVDDVIQSEVLSDALLHRSVESLNSGNVLQAISKQNPFFFSWCYLLFSSLLSLASSHHHHQRISGSDLASWERGKYQYQHQRLHQPHPDEYEKCGEVPSSYARAHTCEAGRAAAAAYSEHQRCSTAPEQSCKRM